MVDGTIPTDGPGGMSYAERLDRLREYRTQWYNSSLHDSGYTYAWQRWPPAPADTPARQWWATPAFGGATSYIVIKETWPHNEISICAPPVFNSASHSGSDSEMRHWRIPLSVFASVKIAAVSADVAQDLLLVAQGIPNSW